MGDSDHEEGRKEERRADDRRQLPRDRRAGPGRRIWIRRFSTEEVDEERRESDRRSGEPRRGGGYGERNSAVRAISASTDESFT